MAVVEDPEYTVVDLAKQLDTDEDGSDDTNALTPVGDEPGDDTEDLDEYRNRSGEIWRGE